MYGRGSGVASTIGGVAILPYTSGNSIATILAGVAIAFGIGILISQLVVRILRRKYSK